MGESNTFAVGDLQHSGAHRVVERASHPGGLEQRKGWIRQECDDVEQLASRCRQGFESRPDELLERVRDRQRCPRLAGFRMSLEGTSQLERVEGVAAGCLVDPLDNAVRVGDTQPVEDGGMEDVGPERADLHALKLWRHAAGRGHSRAASGPWLAARSAAHPGPTPGRRQAGAPRTPVPRRMAGRSIACRRWRRPADRSRPAIGATTAWQPAPSADRRVQPIDRPAGARPRVPVAAAPACSGPPRRQCRQAGRRGRRTRAASRRWPGSRSGPADRCAVPVRRRAATAWSCPSRARRRESAPRPRHAGLPSRSRPRTRARGRIRLPRSFS